MHNIHEVILYIMYNDQLLQMFPSVCIPCDSFTRISTPSLGLHRESTSTEIIRYYTYNTT